MRYVNTLIPLLIIICKVQGLITCGKVSINRSKCSSQLYMINPNLRNKISEDIRQATSSKFIGSEWKGGYGGGGGASVGVLQDIGSGVEYFCKIGGLGSTNMLTAEFFGIKEIYETSTIRVPRPICCGIHDYDSYVVFEKMNMGGSGAPEEMARKLAAMHRVVSNDGMFGWSMDNTIGATFQPNKKCGSWAEFWDINRLGHMLDLCKREGAVFPQEHQLREKVKSILSTHNCVPSLVHGDLWSGNRAFTKEGEPVIFDPATYYGDREVDIAMTYLFVSFSSKFYSTYNDEWPLPEGHEDRRVIYNLYHILNHYVLFGGGYLNEAYHMIAKIMNL